MATEVDDPVVVGPSNRTPHDVLEESRAAMEELAAKMLFVKKEGRPKSELRELITQMSLIFITLRQVNRSILLEEERVKAETEGAKAPVDFTTLQLHNLVYEKNHYLKAIKACKDFRTKYPNIELVPEEDFFRGAPEDIKGGALSTDGPHDLMLKRLNYELHQRKELCKLHEKLEQRKKDLLETIANQKRFLSSLPSHLKSLKKASLPVQQQLGILHTKKLKQNRAAELLPPPLYIIYSQLQSQKEAFGENIELEVLGSIKEAQAFAQQQANKDIGMPTNTEANRLEEDALDDDDDGQRRRKRPKKLLSKDNLDNSGIYQSHPLNVILHVYDDEYSDVKPLKLISLRFEYLVKLNVVCVGVEGAAEGTENILCNLFPDDTGIELPHQTAKLCAGDSAAFDKRSLRPYKWAQHLGGMDILPELSPLLAFCGAPRSEMVKGESVPSGLVLYRHQNRTQTFVQRIRIRKKAQMALEKQLEFLAKLKWPQLSFGNVPWALHSPVCTLEQWLIIRPISDPVSSISAMATEQATDSLDLDSEGRFTAAREELESAREDGELPSAVQIPPLLEYLKLTPLKVSAELEHCRSLTLMSKSSTPSSKGKSQSFRKHEDSPELVVDSESDVEQPFLEPEQELLVEFYEKAKRGWEDYAVKEYHMVLCRTDTDKVKLEAKIKISMEHPLRPPLFSLSLVTDLPEGDSLPEENDGAKWFNELRAMEAEVNLHILKIIPLDYENEILSHQISCLAMLFDFQIDQLQKCSGLRKSTSIIDVGLCKPVTGTIFARSFRGRDRRKMISWKSTECTQGYPY
uniref:THO complex subunit 5 n=2 Tax=Anthurium amnicola TaxID=1678845 RepID=A0A1D1XZS6_9ARAE